MDETQGTGLDIDRHSCMLLIEARGNARNDRKVATS